MENLSRLSPLPLLSSSALDSSPAPESLLHTVLFPTLPQPTVSHLAVHFYLYFTPPISLYCTVNIFQLLSNPPPPPHLCLPSSLLTANICDEEMLLCQNGGTCYQNQKCICPPEFKGVLCQHSRCEAGKDCNAASSPHISTAGLLLCTLLANLLATIILH